MYYQNENINKTDQLNNVASTFNFLGNIYKQSLKNDIKENIRISR